LLLPLSLAYSFFPIPLTCQPNLDAEFGHLTEETDVEAEVVADTEAEGAEAEPGVLAA
jgi:hypothetical protein